MTTRRDFLVGAGSAGLASTAGTATQAAAVTAPAGHWDQGRVSHLLPTASHDRFLIKASFDGALESAPELHVGSNRVRGRKNIAGGDFWQFDVPGLKPATSYPLSLISGGGRALCEPWPLSTLPAPDATPSHCRLLIYTCAGGHDVYNNGLAAGRVAFLPLALRRRLLMRGLSFQPDAVIANGDHV
jgi:hypothetical protein